MSLKIMPKFRILLLCLFLCGSAIRAVDVWRPVDGSIRESWRECDTASVARNYFREGMNLFYPRIDWRGDGPGYTEMEFPLYPWLIAVLYKIFGFHEVIGRLLSFLFSLITMGIFFQLAQYLLPKLGAITACLFFVLSPLVVRISNSLQPDGLMFLCYILAVYAFIRWIEEDSWKYYGIALIATSLAILAKATVAHIGIFFAIVLLTHKGFKVLSKVRIWIFAIVALLPSILWYSHAYKFWLTYGNSLGLSNESHWIGWDFFTNPAFIVGIVALDVFYAWMPTSVFMAGFGIVLRKGQREIKYSLYWLLAIAIYYFIAARTTGDYWADYYHVVSVPPVAILIGTGIEAIYHVATRCKYRLRAGVIIPSMILGIILAIIGYSMGKYVKLPIFIVSCLLLIIVSLNRPWNWKENLTKGKSQLLTKLTIYFAVVSVSATFFFQILEVRGNFHPSYMKASYECAMRYLPHIPESSLIVASGGFCKDATGHPVAYNAPYFLYWLDRKGFNICIEEQSIEALNVLIKRGAEYYVAERWALQGKPGFESELRKEFKLLQECSQTFLFDLTSGT